MQFGRYVVLDWLGAGGMGVVYSAHDPELNRKVALKVIGHGSARFTETMPAQDLLREARTMAQLAHPNVVTVFDAGSIDDCVFIAMELVEGLTLSRWLAVERRERAEILAVFLAAGRGLAAAHEAGLIHRDFKPDNVLIGRDGRVRVTDFGLARPAARESRDATAARSVPRDSAPSGPAGTLAYMAPEQCVGRSADARADQFSFAVALYEALHGDRPFAPLELADGDRAASHDRKRTMVQLLRLDLGLQCGRIEHQFGVSQSLHDTDVSGLEIAVYGSATVFAIEDRKAAIVRTVQRRSESQNAQW